MTMPWSLEIGEVKGTSIRVHATFLILVLWVAAGAWLERQSLLNVIDRTLLLLAVFGVVVLHELGHATMGLRYGIRTREITLLPIGGVARMDRIPTIPAQELAVALAGPAVNVVLAALIFAALTLAGSPPKIDENTMTGGSFALRLMLVNISLAVFNLLPALPMDGGRVLRAILAMRMGHAQATVTAAKVGQGIALLLGLLGLAANPVLVLIALFVWFSAEMEAQVAVQELALTDIPVRQVMRTDFHTLSPGDPLARAVALRLAYGQREIPVVAGGRLLGLLTQDRLLEALRWNPKASAGEVMSSDVEPVQPGEMLAGLLARLYQQPGARAIAVVDEGRFLGLVTAENLADFLLFKDAAGGGPGPAPRLPTTLDSPA